MINLVTGKEMQLLDKRTSEHFHVPTVVLMEQAANMFVQKLLSLFSDKNKILIVCGLGNNGADGLAIARLLNQNGKKAFVYDMQTVFPDKKGTELFELQKDILTQYQYPFVTDIRKEDGWDLVVDALFGIGLSRNITGAYADTIEAINGLDIPIAAVDIASGINADTAEVCGIAVKASATITFSFAKLGHYLWPGSEYCGKLIVAPMGITSESLTDNMNLCKVLEDEDLHTLLPIRRDHSNKGTYGKVLIIAGSKGMSGAAYLSARSAYRMGAGLVQIYTHESNRIILQQLLPEAIITTYESGNSDGQLPKLLQWCSSAVIGPGIGLDEDAKQLVNTVMTDCKKPIVADADALTLLSVQNELFHIKKCDLIITPHLGEMSKLTGESISDIQTSLFSSALEFAVEYHLTCVLKDFHTVVVSWKNQKYLNLSGNHGMATGGSGDCLTGIIASLLAQKIPPEIAAATGVFVHGRAGDAAAEIFGKRSLLAGDIADGITLVMKDM